MSTAAAGTTVDAAMASGEAPRERVPLHVWCLLASLVFNLFSGHSDQLGFPLGPDRIFFAAALGLLVLDPERPRLTWRPLFGVMIALVLWTAGSAMFAGTLTTSMGMFALLDRICVPFLMFVLGPLVFTTARRRRLLLWTMTLTGLYLGATAVFEMVGPTSLVWPSYIMNPDLGILFGRARGPFVSAEPNGMVMGIALFMAMTLWSTVGGWRRALCTAAVALCALGEVLCLTRSNWVATIVAGLVIGYLVPSVRRRLPLVVVGLVAAFALFLVAVPAAAEVLSQRLSMLSSVYDRQNTNAAAMRIIAERPIFGIGWGQYLQIGPEWVRQADTYPLSNVNIEVHNVFLSRAAETGLPGSLMWIIAVALGPAAAVWRMPRSGEARTWSLITLACLAYWFLPSMSSPNPYPLPNNLMWLVGGFAGSTLLAGARGRRDEESPTAAA